jgi:hypothetical protein
MNVATQISGNIRPGNKALAALHTMLAHVGINVAHPAKDEPLFYGADKSTVWHHYDKELEFYNHIGKSSFHIVHNDGAIDNEIGLQILYAMLKERPILMTGAPVFAEDCNLFIRDTLKKHLQEFHSVNLPELELTELSLLLQKLRPTSYSLSKNEKVLINAGVKMLFRNLLSEANGTRPRRVHVALRPVSELPL